MYNKKNTSFYRSIDCKRIKLDKQNTCLKTNTISKVFEIN